MTAMLDTPRVPREVPDWHALGACRDYPALNFADPGQVGDAFDKPPTAAERRLAEAACRIVCAGCPFRLACAVGGLERQERWGVWGGLTYEDRKRVAAQYGYLPPGDPPPHGTDSRYKKWHCRCPECRRGHALYESMRRERVRLKRLGRELWYAPIVLAAPYRSGRRLVLPGQLLLPLPITKPAALHAAA